MIMLVALALFSGTFQAMAQNSFPTPGGASVPGIVQMCITANQAKPCVGAVTAGPDSSFTTPGGATVGGAVRMCINGSQQAVPC